ncbi:hypothetical protein B0H13DRAFT_1877031 [Mycena leptocephala]|nr:hypothetical protein B0H13DRAFT_1877031 [Mycena leptocephala]
MSGTAKEHKTVCLESRGIGVLALLAGLAPDVPAQKGLPARVGKVGRSPDWQYVNNPKADSVRGSPTPAHPEILLDSVAIQISRCLQRVDTLGIRGCVVATYLASRPGLWNAAQGLRRY